MNDQAQRLSEYLQASGLPGAAAALLGAGQFEEAGWVVVNGLPGSRVRVDGITPLQQAAAQAAVTAFDWSQAAYDVWAAQRAGSLPGALTAVRLGVARNSSVITLADVTGLTFQLRPNSHYAYEFVGACSAAAATTGLKLAVNGPASPALVRIAAWLAESVTAARYFAGAAYDTPIIGLNSGAAVSLPFAVKGNVSTGPTGGPFSLRFASEVAGSQVTIGAGSYGLLYGVG